MRHFALLLVVLLFALLASSQNAPGKPATSIPQRVPSALEGPPANPADVASPDAVIAALYDVISGPAGKKRDWDRFRSLFAPGARMISVGPRLAATGGGFRARVLSPEEYIAASGPILENNGFFENEIARRTERFGDILHAFSTYEGRRTSLDEKPFLRGINSIQLYSDGARWWIVTVLWQPESPTNSCPPNISPADTVSPL